MASMTRALCLCLFLTWLLAVPLASAAEVSRSDWTVETEVREGEDDQSTIKHLAVFRRPYVYSFDHALNSEITVLDLLARRFELLDPQRQLRTSIDGSQVFAAMLQIDDRASRANDLHRFADLLRFAAAPSFMVEFHREGLELNLNSDLLAYRLKCTQIDAEQLSAYMDFADWSARLTALHPGGLPATARIQVNRELRMRQLAPQEVARTIRWQGKAIVARTTHRFRDTVSAEEREKVAEIDRLREKFTRVELSQYFQSHDETVRPTPKSATGPSK